MTARFILTDYVDRALDSAEYEKLDDGTFAGRMPACPGAVAVGSTLRACEVEPRSVLEDWILVGLKLGHTLPIIDGIDLYRESVREPMEAVSATGFRPRASSPRLRRPVLR